jgi:hypothetical protein
MCGELCPGCGTQTVCCPGIGPYCPNPDCLRSDDLREFTEMLWPRDLKPVTQKQHKNLMKHVQARGNVFLFHLWFHEYRV